MSVIANTAYRSLLDTVMTSGSVVAPRGLVTRELLGYQTKIDMKYPIITIPSRKINYRFMAAEAYWMLTGQQGLDELLPYCKRMSDFSDDGLTLSGAYGPRFIQQARYIVDTLVSDGFTRQAAMTFWERNPRPSKDIPCTVSLQWLLRENKLHCIAYMRSQDCWLGYPYDAFTFTMMTCYIVSLARSFGYHANWELGDLRIVAGSQHLYETNNIVALETIQSDPVNDGGILAINTHGLIHPGVPIECLGYARTCPNDQVLYQIQSILCHSKPLADAANNSSSTKNSSPDGASSAPTKE